VYNITLMASNSAGNAMQAFTLTVLQTPAITSLNNATFQVGVFGSFTVTTTDFPSGKLIGHGNVHERTDDLVFLVLPHPANGPTRNPLVSRIVDPEMLPLVARR
jgi:hypothetical protein